MPWTRNACFLFITIACFAQTICADDWPQWRGPQRDGVSRETGLLKQWPEQGPAVLWQVDNVGVGYSSLVIKDGRVITQGDLDGVEHIIAYNEKDGSLLWAVQPEPVAKVLNERVEKDFEKYDANHDGKLDELEAVTALGANFGQFDTVEPGEKEAVAKDRAARLLAQLDKDGNDTLSFSEVPGPMQQNIDKIDEEDKKADGIALAKQRAEELVKAADKDADGKISKDEAKRTSLEKPFDKIDAKVAGTDKGDGFLAPEEIEQYFFAKEPGRDGLLSRVELENYFLKNFPGKDGILMKADLRRSFGGYRNGYGDGPRGTPTIDGDKVYAEGGNGDVTCLDAATGKTIWHLNMQDKLEGGRPGWGYCESPLVTGDLVIVTPGGKGGTLAALNKNTGEVVWRSATVTQRAHYSSPLVAEIAGVKQIVQFSHENLFGVTIDGGKLLWTYNGANNGTANIATPTIFGEYVLASSAYGKGAGLAKVKSLNADLQEAEQVYFQPKLANHHGGIVKVDEFAYGSSGPLVCMNFLTGDIAWQNRSIGKGSVTVADGMLYCLGENYEVALVEVNPKEYVEHGHFKIEGFGRPAWAHPVVANGKLFLRNQQRLTAYDVRAK